MYTDLHVMEVPLHFLALLHPFRIDLRFHSQEYLHDKEPSETPAGYSD
jgi:hypothetical protein